MWMQLATQTRWTKVNVRVCVVSDMVLLGLGSKPTGFVALPAEWLDFSWSSTVQVLVSTD